MDGLTGVTVSDTSVADVTLSEAVPLTDPDLAVIVVDPTAAVVARPARLMVATLVAEDAQLAEDVRSWVLPSEYVPVALNWAVVPFAIDGLAGDTAIDTSAAAVTFKGVLPLTDPDLAVMVVAPTAAPVATPVAPMVATLLAEDVQFAEDVRSWVLPSEYVPVALNWAVVPFAIDGLAGDTAIDTSAAGVTFKSVLPMIEFIVAVIVAVPTATPVTRPWLPTRLPTVATAADEEVQVTFLVKSFVVPSP